MSSASGWYPDPNNERVMRFWNGAQWNAERSLDVGSNVEPVAAPVAGSSVRTQAQEAVAVLSKVSPTGWLLFAGAAVAAFGTLLPWEQDTTPFGTQLTAGPSTVPGGVAMLMALVAAVVCIGWPARAGGALSKARCIGLTVVVACLAAFALAKFASLAGAPKAGSTGSDGSDLFGDLQINSGLSYHAGSGLFIYAAGLLSIWAGVVSAWFARLGISPRKTAA